MSNAPSQRPTVSTAGAAREILARYMRTHNPANSIPSSTRDLSPELSALLRSLRPGQRIRITQTVRVGLQEWQTTVTGRFRAVNFLETGLATQRVRADDIVVVLIRFTKDNGEMSSITVDEHTKVEALEG